LLLRGILKNTDKVTESDIYIGIQSALNDLEIVAVEINDGLHKKEARLRVVEVQAHLEGCSIPLVTPTRYHVLDGPLNKKYNNTGFKMASFKKYWFFLFNDMMMYTTVPNAKGDCRLKYILPLMDMSVVNIADGILGKDLKYAFELKGSVKTFVVHAFSEDEKQEWLSKLEQAIDNIKTKRARIPFQLTGASTSRTISSTSGAGASYSNSSQRPNSYTTSWNDSNIPPQGFGQDDDDD